MVYHEVVHNETRRGAQHTVGMAVLVYCLAAGFGMLHFVQKYVPAQPINSGLFWHPLRTGSPSVHEPNASTTSGDASERETAPSSTCPAGHFCAYPLGNQTRLVDCTVNDGRGVSPCYLWITEVNAYAFRTPVLPCLLPLLPAALALLCQAGGNGAGEIMLQRRQVAVKAIQRVATYVVFMMVFQWCYGVKAGLEREFLGGVDASGTVAAFMLATTIAWREYAHLCKSRGNDCTTGMVFLVCIAQLVCSMYLIYQTCQYFQRPWESVGGMIGGWILCYFLFYVTTADSGVFGGFAGTRDAPFNSPGLCNVPKREPFISKNEDRRRQSPGFPEVWDGVAQDP